MNEFFQKVLGRVKTAWNAWSLVQRLIFIGIIAGALIAVIALAGVSSRPTFAQVIDVPVADEVTRNKIITRINQEGVKTFVNPQGIVSVADEETARRMRSILIREDLIPAGTDPWAIFDIERWTITDFERDVNFRRAITAMVTAHIKSLDEIDNADVTIVQPERTLFASDQNPVTASVIITPRPGSDITQNRKKIEGIQKILKFAVEGLVDENIVITDTNGLVLNDFQNMADIDRLSVIDRGNKLIQNLEAKYRAQILKQLQTTFSDDRVRDLAVKIDMDMSRQEVKTDQPLPYIRKPRTPGLAYDDSEIADSVTLSETRSVTSWEGTGFNPEGPAGVEGQTPPAFKDMSNLVGKVTQETVTHNEQIGREIKTTERTPQIDRVTVSVNIDGVWRKKYDEQGRMQFEPNGHVSREYVPLTDAEVGAARSLIENAIGYSAVRSDSVTVQNIAFDRTAQFDLENAEIARQRQMRLMIIIGLVGLVALFAGFIIVQAILKARERKRQREEAERARQAQLRREAALLEAEREGAEPELSAEEQAQLEIFERATTLAREQPQNAAQLIRTWLMEE